MRFDILFLLLMMSFTVHLLILVFYFINKSKKLFILFISTAFSNIIIGMILTVVAFQNPSNVKNMNLSMILWVLSGFVALIMLCIKIYIFRNIFKRWNDPEMYHHNYFGKKVYHLEIVKKWELATIILTIPIFVIFGAYFISKMRVVIP